MNTSHTQVVMTSACLQRNVSFPSPGPSHIIAVSKHNVSTAEDRDDVATTKRFLVFAESKVYWVFTSLKDCSPVRCWIADLCPRATHPEPSAVITACRPQFSIRAVCNGMLARCVCFRKQIETVLPNLSKPDPSPFLMSTPAAAAGWVIRSCCVAHNITTTHRTAVPRITCTTRFYFDQVKDPPTLHYTTLDYSTLH